jgi:hypothetical protein
MSRVIFATPELREKFRGNQDYARKIDEIVDRGPQFGTPGPTILDSQAKHCHVDNQIGIAWIYLPGVFQDPKQAPCARILALGRKDNSTGGTSGYKWSNKGDV